MEFTENFIENKSNKIYRLPVYDWDTTRALKYEREKKVTYLKRGGQ